MSRPDMRIVYKDKASGKSAECGVMWLSDRVPGSASLKPQVEKQDGEYPKIPLERAVTLAAEGKGYLNVYACLKGGQIVIDGAGQEGDFSDF